MPTSFGGLGLGANAVNEKSVRLMAINNCGGLGLALSSLAISRTNSATNSATSSVNDKRVINSGVHSPTNSFNEKSVMDSITNSLSNSTTNYVINSGAGREPGANVPTNSAERAPGVVSLCLRKAGCTVREVVKVKETYYRCKRDLLSL